ncbi:MAG: preprotein translocase subunit YajC, partial [Acidithiobacillus sp.]
MNFSPIANAYAGTAAGAGPDSVFMQVIPLVIIFGIFYFLLIRPQMKKAKEQRQLISAISKGDEVVTQGGLAGRIMQ